MALCLTIAIKNKASNDEIFSILKDVPNPNQDDDDGKVSSARFCKALFTVYTSELCVCWLAKCCVLPSNS